MMTAAVEEWDAVLPELMPHLPKHWHALALNKDKVPLDPQWNVYAAKQANGELMFMGLRQDGELVGYFIGFIAPGLHYKSCLTCVTDLFYVAPEARNCFGGLRLFRMVERELRRRGVQRWFMGSKNHADCTRLFAAIGAEPVETFYAKWLGS